MEKLTWDNRLGGLTLSSFKKYYLAAQMKIVRSLFELKDIPSWIQIALYPLKEEVYSDLFYKYNPSSTNIKADNPILTHLLKIWYQVQQSWCLKMGLSPRTPLKQNALIPMTLNNKILNIWYSKVVQRL